MNKAMYRSASFRSTVTVMIIGIAVIHTVRKYSKIKR